VSSTLASVKMADSKDFGNDAFTSHDEKNGVSTTPSSPDDYTGAADRRASVALNIVENPLMVSIVMCLSTRAWTDKR
jgi:hypothetical protein